MITKKIIIGNWKMNPASQKEAVELFDAIKTGAQNSGAEVVICPPYIYLSELKAKPGADLCLGAQNVSLESKGAFTGQISASQLKDLGVEYVLIGHSEVRNYLRETDEVINRKTHASLKADVKPVICIGEDEGDDKIAVLTKQLMEGLIDILDVSNVIIAYEPVWAIGTGNNCTAEETQSTVLLIKKILTKMFGENAKQIRVIYGGSVNSSNAQDYLKNGGVDGLLLGGASLKPEEFIKIAHEFK